jgi:hypothetical protein
VSVANGTSVQINPRVLGEAGFLSPPPGLG